MIKESNIDTLLSFHKVTGTGNKRKEREYLKRIAHLEAVADITDRVSGSKDVYYEKFDETNDHSVGKIDLALVDNITEGSLQEDGVNFAKLGTNVFQDFKVGQEVTLINIENKTKYLANILRISNNEDKCYIGVSNKDIPLNANYTICRSMAKIIENKLHLYPSDMLEHDIRLNIDFEGEKAYTIVSWIEHEEGMTLPNYEQITQDTSSIRSVTNFQATRVNKLTKDVSITWGANIDKRVTNLKLYRTTTGYLKEPTGNPVATLDKNTTSYTETVEREQVVYYYTLFSFAQDGRYSIATASVDLVDTTPPPNVTNLKVTESNKDLINNLVDLTLSWTNPTVDDFEKVMVYEIIDGRKSLKYEGKGTSITYREQNVPTIIDLVIETVDRLGNKSSMNYELSTITTNLYEGVEGFSIDFNKKATPSSMFSYIANSTSIKTPMAPDEYNNVNYNDWKDRFPFNAMKPCLINKTTGEPFNKYLSPYNLTQFEDGSNASNYITGTELRNWIPCMEIPKIYWTSKMVDNKLYVFISSKKVTDDFVAFAHTYDGVEKDVIYHSIGFINAGGESNKGLSVKVGSYNTMKDIISRYLPSNCRMYNYANYLLFQILMTLALGGKLDVQEPFIPGYTSNSNNNILNAPQVGINYCHSSGFVLLGVDRPWHNYREYIDGIKMGANCTIMLDKNNNGNYEPLYQTTPRSIGTLNDVQGDTYGIFLPKANAVLGDTNYNTPLYDAVEIKDNENGVCSTLNMYNDGLRCGIYSMTFGINPTEDGNNRTCRVLFIPK